MVDLTEFATGRSVTSGNGHHKWGGDFTGRATLIAELAPTIRTQFTNVGEHSVQQLMQSLRNFWRHLDSIATIAPCEHLVDVNESIAALWAHSGVPLAYYNDVRKIIFAARKACGLPTQVWPKVARGEAPPTDTPSQTAVKALYITLKGLAQKIMAYWAKGDELAAKGLDPRSAPQATVGQPLTYADPANRATLLKALMEECATPIPPLSAFPDSVRSYGSDAPLVPGAHSETCNGLGGQLRWFYPSFEDTCVFLLLFLLLTGWNNQVAFDLDASNEKWHESHPLRDDIVMIHSIKHRAGGTEQTAISLVKPRFHPYQLLCALIERTNPLRDELRRRLAAAESAFANDPANFELRKEVDRLREGVRSPWLCFSRNNLGEIQWLKGGMSTRIGEILDAVVEQANERIRKLHAFEVANGRATGNPELIRKLVLSDFRDAWIGYAYANSGYNWLIAKLAAGHNTLNALRDYLRKKRWRAHSEKQYRKFMDALWTEIGERRVVDPAILRWLVEHGEITDEQRQRWEAHKDRTRMGVGCKDFHNPPPEIAPDHVDGCGCRVQRCTLCRHAVVFEDSLDGIAMRMAELEHIQASISLTAWNDSSFPDEVEETQKTFTLFKPDAVQAALEKWRNEIASGRHYVFQFEGSYQEATHG